jgi:hypothetical protein
MLQSPPLPDAFVAGHREKERDPRVIGSPPKFSTTVEKNVEKPGFSLCNSGVTPE